VVTGARAKAGIAKNGAEVTAATISRPPAKAFIISSSYPAKKAEIFSKPLHGYFSACLKISGRLFLCEV
jgi:hypothetical protein